MVDAMVSEVTKALHQFVRLGRVSLSGIEQGLGWKKGTLARLFAGRTQLTLRHVVLLLNALHLEPEHFSTMISPSPWRRKRSSRPRARLGARPRLARASDDWWDL